MKTSSYSFVFLFLTKAYSNYLLFYCPCRYIYLLSPYGIVKECKDQVTKLKNPSKVSGDSPISLYYSLIYGNCLGNVVMGMEKCGKMCENV